MDKEPPLDCKALKANPLTVNSQDLWLAKDNRFLNPKSSYERILLAPPCRLINGIVTFSFPHLLFFAALTILNSFTDEIEYRLEVRTVPSCEKNGEEVAIET